MAAEFGPQIERLYAVAGAPSKRTVAIAGARDVREATSTRVHVLQLPKARPLFSGEVAGAVHALAFMGDELLVAGTEHGTLCGWEVSGSTGEKVASSEETSGHMGLEPLFKTSPHSGAVRGLAVDPLGRRLVSVGDDGVLVLLTLRVEAGRPGLLEEVRWQLSARPLCAVAIDPGSGAVAVAGEDGVIRVVAAWGATEGASPAKGKIREMPCGEGGIRALAFTGDGRIVAGCGDGSIRLCYLEGAIDEENRSAEAAHSAPVTGLVFGPEHFDEAGRPLSRRLFSVSEDGTLKGWILDIRRKQRTLEVSSSPVFGVAWIPAAGRAKAEEAGGTLALVNRDRQLLLVTLNEKSEPASDVRSIGSELARLAESLEAKSPKVRLAAVEALEPLLEDDARQLLDRALSSDDHQDVRRLAARAIGRTNRRLSRPALRAAVNDAHRDVRSAAVGALVAIEGEKSLAPIRAALASRYPDIRQAAVARLPGLKDVSPLVPALIAARLRDDHNDVRLAALETLYVLEGADSLAPVRTVFERGPADVRAEALQRLCRSGRAEDPEGYALVEAALDDEDESVRHVAFSVALEARPRLASALRTRDPLIHKALWDLEQKKAGKGSTGGNVRPTGDSGGDSVDRPSDEDRQMLFAALACRHPDTALRGARCLALMADARATGALLQLSRERDVTIRRAVVEALQVAAMAMPWDDRLTARLEWLLDDDDADLRAAAFESLKHLAAPHGANGLLEHAARALRSSREDIRTRALQILVLFGGRGRYARILALAERADVLLGEALDDEAAGVRAEAFRTLWAWHSTTPESPLRRAVGSAHADIRKMAVAELERQKGDWVEPLLISLVSDSSSQAGLAAYKALTGDDKKKVRAEIHLAALRSPRPAVRAAGCKGCRRVDGEALRSGSSDVQPSDWGEVLRARLIELVEDTHPEVHLAAIEAVDRLLPDNVEAFHAAFGSIFYELRVHAGELCGKRRDRRAVGPMTALLSIPKTDLFRPADELRRRAARALADVGDPGSEDFYVALLDDEDGIVREMGARGLATACRPGMEQSLADALSHEDLAIRSWVAEGLARLGDRRAVPVLTGTLKHQHRPIRIGAVLGFVALGPDGIGGILQGLEDWDRDIQDLVFAVIVARDVALVGANLPPDLLLSALSSSHPETRFAAARILELRAEGETFGGLAQELVGPRKPERAADMKDWPAPAQRVSLLNVVVAALASDHPAQRYAAAQVLALRAQPEAFWREARRLASPTDSSKPWIPHTNWEDEERQPRKKSWIRCLFDRPTPKAETGTERVLTVLKFAGDPSPRAVPPVEEVTIDGAELYRLAFGAYAGLIRQAPAPGEADETHRVRRDSLERLAVLAGQTSIGRAAVLPGFRRALSDPHHLVRKAALSALRGLYPAGALEPLGLALESSSADVGRVAVDELVNVALSGKAVTTGAAKETEAAKETAAVRGTAAREAAGKEAAAAREMVKQAINAPNADVRAYALGRLPRLFEPGSLEPWLLALESRYADLRLAVVDRLMFSTDSRVQEALEGALASDHEDLRLKAAVGLARRGDARTIDVLAAFLRSEERRTSEAALEALVVLAQTSARTPGGQTVARTGSRAKVSAESQDTDSVAARVAEAVASRLDDDPDRTADRPGLIGALSRIGHRAGDEVLLKLLADEDAAIRDRAFSALLEIARDRKTRPIKLLDGTLRQRYLETRVLAYLGRVASSQDEKLRERAARVLADIDGAEAEGLLGRLVEDRNEAVRVAACETLAFRAEHVKKATLERLEQTLRAGRRELVLPAARGLATQRRPEAFQALMLVFKAGAPEERERAVLGLGQLGDRRVLEELLPLVDPRAEIPEEDRFLAPATAEALGAMLPHLEQEEERQQVRETVERLARTGDETVRLRALTGLRRAGDARSRSLLERVAGDKYEEAGYRQRAIRELGILRDEDSETLLAELLDDDQRGIRNDALAALGRIFPRARTRVNLAALQSRHPDISQPAASFLALRGEPSTLVSQVAGIKDLEVRERLRRGLVKRGAVPVAEVVRLLGSEAAAPRAEAAWLAGATKDERLYKPVMEALERSARDWRQVYEARLAAGDGRAAGGTGGGIGGGHAGGSGDGGGTSSSGGARVVVRRVAGIGMAPRAGESSLKELEEAWLATLWAARQLGLEAESQALEAAGRVEAPARVRREALRLLEARGTSKALGVLEACLTDADAEVRNAAAAAVARVASQAEAGAGKVLQGVLERAAVADVASMQPLVGAALETEGEALLRSEQGRRLVLPAMLGSGREETLLKAAAASGTDSSRMVAIASLGRIGSEGAAAGLKAILDRKGEAETVRAAAYRALRRSQRAREASRRGREDAE